ncbi:MAG: alpha/beta hydrolase [Patescibacteria group bacterium]
MSKPKNSTAPEEVYINSGNLRLYAKIWEVNKKNPTIILLHSLSFHSFEYDKLAPKLVKAGFNCITFDFSCHGKSEGERGYWILTQFVLDTKSVIDYAHKRFNDGVGVFGNSLGAITGIYAASQNSGIKSLALAGCPTVPAEFLLTPFNNMLINFFNICSYIISFTVGVKHFIPYHKLFVNQKFIKKIKEDPLVAPSRKISPFSYNKAAKWNAKEAARKINVPLLVMHGKKDRIIPKEQSEMLYREAADPKEFKFINTGHMPTFENPDMLAKILKEFFNKTLK